MNTRRIERQRGLVREGTRKRPASQAGYKISFLPVRAERIARSSDKHTGQDLWRGARDVDNDGE